MSTLNQRIDQLERALRATGPVGSAVTPSAQSSMNMSTPVSADTLVGVEEDSSTEDVLHSITDQQGMLEACHKPQQVYAQRSVTRAY